MKILLAGVKEYWKDILLGEMFLMGSTAIVYLAAIAFTKGFKQK